MKAKKSKKQILELPETTMIEVVRVSRETGEALVKIMSFGEWRLFNKNKAYSYTAYQRGFSQFNIKNKKK